MTAIHPFIPRFSNEGVARLRTELVRALEAGEDLGPRWPQIQALKSSLEVLCKELQQTIDGIDHEVAANPDIAAALDNLRTYIAVVSRIIAATDAFERPD